MIRPHRRQLTPLPLHCKILRRSIYSSRRTYGQTPQETKDNLLITLQQSKEINEDSSSKTIEERNDQRTQEATATHSPTLQEPKVMDNVPQYKTQELHDKTTH